MFLCPSIYHPTENLHPRFQNEAGPPYLLANIYLDKPNLTLGKCDSRKCFNTKNLLYKPIVWNTTNSYVRRSKNKSVLPRKYGLWGKN